MELVKDNNPIIKQVNTPEDLAKSALEIFLGDAQNAIDASGSFKVAVSGGHTPERFFELLGQSPEVEQLEWENVHLFWVDERCVPPEAKASNYGLAAHTFIDKVPIPRENVHRVLAESDDYAVAVHKYEETIRRVFAIMPGQIPQFDLIVLGMGQDGHIGSLFPNSYAHFDTEDLVSAVYLMEGDYNRITLTHPVLCAAAHLMILVSGAEKAEILKDVLQGELDEVKYPVHTLWPILSKVTWLVDSQAARKL